MLMSVVQVHLSPPDFGFRQSQEPSKPAVLLGWRVFCCLTLSQEIACSGTRSHRVLKQLRKKGYITLAVDEMDNRVKAVLPTALAMQYFDVMGKCRAAA
jgi:hypothetical protein